MFYVRVLCSDGVDCTQCCMRSESVDLHNFVCVCAQMVLVLKKEVVKTNNVEHEDTGKFRQLLVRTLHQCSVKFPDVASTIIPVVRYQPSLCCQIPAFSLLPGISLLFAARC